MSFYRIYRPQVIDEIDNVAVREQLLSLAAKDRKDLPHAYLFTGPRGAGKTTAARIVAKIFNCTKPTKHGPCGACQQCDSIAHGRNMDVLEMDAASNRGIEEIRQLRDAVNLAPASAAYKVYIIDEVHMLTTEAFNALLKTLEEPPAHVVFVLATTDKEKVPATITSRCIGVPFHKATDDELSNALARIIKQEKLDVAEGALAEITHRVDGAFRDAVKLLEQASLAGRTITADLVRRILSASDESAVADFLAKVREKDAQASLDFISALAREGTDMKSFIQQCLLRLHQELIATREEKTKELIRLFVEAYGMMKISPIPELPLELAVVEYCGSAVPEKPSLPSDKAFGMLTLEKLTEHWPDFIAAIKPYNNSIAGVLRSARPKDVAHGIVTVEAFYQFHKDKLSEAKTREILSGVLKKLFGETVKIEVVLGRR